MPSEQEIKAREQTKASLERIQGFDVESLPREKELGSGLNFSGVIMPARRLVSLYQRLSLAVLDDLPQQQLNTLRQQADADYNKIKQILDFSPEQSNPKNVRDSLIQQIENSYQAAFNTLQIFIAYSVGRSTDFQSLERDALAAIQGVNDEGEKLRKGLEANQAEAQQILEDVRKVAAEQGVSQQAIYFKTAADEHEAEAEVWRVNTRTMALFIVLYALASLFLHKLMPPSSIYDNIQLAVSKVLIFAVLSYMLLLSARNFLGNKHNAIVNRHRQNALMTFTAIADAAQDPDKKDIVLTHASACIFSPQPTGFSKTAEGSAPTAKSVVELIPSAFSLTGHTDG